MTVEKYLFLYSIHFNPDKSLLNTSILKYIFTLKLIFHACTCVAILPGQLFVHSKNYVKFNSKKTKLY